MDTYIGQQLEQYKIEAHIGSGSSGTVYRATDLNLERPVALKLIKPSLTKQPARQQQILKAAQAASRLSHPAIVPFYNFGQQNGHLYLVTAHVEGISLEQVLALLAQGDRVLRLDETLHIVAQIAEGLGYAHQAGVLHGDLKPGNILLKSLERPLRSGDPSLKAMLADFGLSPIPDSGIPAGLSPELARPLHRYLPYLSPERQAGQPVDGRSDIYSLGIILHQLIAGHLPNHQQPLRDLRPGVPADIANIVAKAIAYAPADRYQMAEQMGDDLRRAASRLTAADTMLFAPQATVVDLRTLLDEDKMSDPVRPPLAALEETAVPSSPRPQPHTQTEEEATPMLPPADQAPQQAKASSEDPPQTILHLSPPPAIGDQIVITGQGRAPRHFSMNKNQITIGRARDNDIVLSSLDVSRHHARLEKVADSWHMVDVDSRGGTFYDGRKLSPQKPEPWQPGHNLQIGPYFLQWQLAEEVEVNPAEQTPAEPITELFQVPVEGSQGQASHSNFSAALNPTQETLLPEEQFELSIWPAHVEDGGTCRVMVRNDGNVHSTVQLTAQDPAGKLQFFGDEQPLRLEPGDTGTTAYRITHRKKRPFFGRVRQIPFEVEIRSSSGLRQNKLGHLEVRPRFPAWVLPLIQLLLVLLLIAVVLNSVLQNRENPAENLPTTPVSSEGTTLPPLTAAQLAGDDDNDGLTGEREVIIGTDPFNPDTDGDGLLDGEEINIHGTNPLLLDTDNDGLMDRAEVEQHNTDPTLTDTDLDGASDGQEIANGTDPLRHDAGGDTAVSQTSPTPEDHSEHDPDAPTATLSPPVTLAPGDNETTVEIPLAADQSGWLTNDGDVESGSSNWPQAGDLEDGTAVRGLLSFSLADIPANAVIRTAFLRFADPTLEGEPFAALGCLQIDFVEVSQPLDNTAYDAPGFFISCESTSPSSIDITFDVEDSLIQGQTLLSLRLGFETESNGDSVADLYVVRTAPTLEVTYLLP